MIDISEKIVPVVTILILMIAGLIALAAITEQQDNLIDPGSSTTTTTYRETFEDDTNESNPTATWYTYTEIGWTWANATNDTAKAHTGNFTYRINDSDGDEDWTDFNFVSDDYEYTKFWFQVNLSAHNETNVTFRKSNGRYMCILNISGDNPTNGNITFSNMTTLGWKHNISNMSYYGVRLDFNYTDDTIRGRLYNYTGGVLNDTWIEMYDGSEVFTEVSHFNISGVSVEPAEICFDNWEVYDSDTSTANGRAPDYDTLDTLESVYPIIGVVLIVAGLMTIVSLAYVYKKR